MFREGRTRNAVLLMAASFLANIVNYFWFSKLFFGFGWLGVAGPVRQLCFVR